MKQRNNMRIAVVVSHPIQHFCPQYASWAAKEGVALKVFFGSRLGASNYFDKDFKQHISWDNLYLEEFDHVFLNADQVLPADKNLRAANLEEQLGHFKPDLVIHYGYFQPLSRQARAWSIKNKVQLGYISDAEFRQQRPLWKRLLKFPYLYQYFKKIDLFFTVGDANETYYKFYGVTENKMKRMHFPIDLRLYKVAWENRTKLKREFLQQHSIAADDIVLSVAGKLVGWKSQDDLIELLKRLEVRSPGKKVVLLMAGSGPEENNWKKKAAMLTHNKVIFLGFVKPAVLPAVYAASAIYIHPALREPHSLSISEAIYMGCPVIVSDTCGSWGPTDDVQEGVNGLVYTHGDINMLEKLVNEILSSADLEKMSVASHTIALAFQKTAHGSFLDQ